MLLRTKRSSQSVDYLLSALSPQQVAASAAAFVAARDETAMLAEIKRSAARMRGSERALYAFALGCQPSDVDDFPIVEPTMDLQDLLYFVDADRPKAIACFATFLERNPRVIRTLDPESISAILLPVIRARQADVDGTDIPDDAPYTYELATALQSLMPAISLGKTVDVLMRPVHATGNAAHAGARFAASVPGRIFAAFKTVVLVPATAIGNGVIAVARFIAAVPGRVFAATREALHAIGRGAIGAGKIMMLPFIALGNGTMALARFIASLPRRVWAALLVPAVAIGKGTSAGARAAGNGGAAALRGLGRGAAVIAGAVAAGIAAIGAGAAALGRAIVPVPGRIRDAWMRMYTGELDTLRAVPDASKRELAELRGALSEAAVETRAAMKASVNAAPWLIARPLAVIGCGVLAAILAASLAAPLIGQLSSHAAAPAVVAAAPVHRSVISHHNVRHVAAKPRIRRIARAENRPKRQPVRIASIPRRAMPSKRPVRASNWKFDPNYNPFTSRVAVRPARGRRVTPVAIARTEPRLVQRARLIVMSYLASLMRGDASTALAHLGLSANAPIANLSEGPVLQRAAGFRIVHAALRNGDRAKIDVEITGPRGRYFGVYTVQASGPAAWITDHTVIPTTAAVASVHG